MSSNIRTPGTTIAVGWIVTVTFLAAYDFVVHVSFRGMLPAFGFEIGPFLQALFGTVVMGLFVVWLVTLAELPEMWFAHRRPALWHRAGRCPACGHPRGDPAQRDCPECGHGFDDVPPPYSLGLTAVRRFSLALLLGMLFGVSAAELHIAVDEDRMRRDAAALAAAATNGGGSPTGHVFHRSWPASFSRVQWSPELGLRPLGLTEMAGTSSGPPSRSP